MNTKLTLYGNKSIADEIKEYAKMHNTSVSKMVFDFFKKTLNKKKNNYEVDLDNLPPTVMSLQGVLKGAYPDDMDPKEEYHKYLEEKYLWKFYWIPMLF